MTPVPETKKKPALSDEEIRAFLDTVGPLETERDYLEDDEERRR